LTHTVPGLARARKGSHRVFASGIGAAIVRIAATLINVVAITDNTIANKAGLARALERSNRVFAIGIGTAIVGTEETLVDVLAIKAIARITILARTIVTAHCIGASRRRVALVRVL
jgi:hypothetical protein